MQQGPVCAATKLVDSIKFNHSKQDHNKLLFQVYVTGFVKRYLFHTFDTPANKLL